MSKVSQILDELRIKYKAIEYDEILATAEEAAEKLGWDLSMIIKTLVVKAKKSGFFIVLVPGDKSIVWAQLAKALGERKVHMASYEEVSEQTGYIVGSVSPFGTTKKLPVVMDSSILHNKQIGINGGARGVEIQLSSQDLLDSLQAQIADICH